MDTSSATEPAFPPLPPSPAFYEDLDSRHGRKMRVGGKRREGEIETEMDRRGRIKNSGKVMVLQ